MNTILKVFIGCIIFIIIFVLFLFYLGSPGNCDHFTLYSEYETNKTITDSEEAFAELNHYLDNKLYTPEFRQFLDNIEECKNISCVQRRRINVGGKGNPNAWVLNNFLAITDDGFIYERGACF